MASKDNNRKVEIAALNKTSITVYMEGYRLALANAIRRIVLSDVPTLAVDFAYFYDNSTGVPDEIIAHRLGLVVLDSLEAIRKLRPPEECRESSEKDESCYVEILLNKEHPQEAESGIYVLAEELSFSHPYVKPVYPKTPIVYLAPGQKIYLVAYARLGRGREHGKWMPASASILQYLPVVEFDGEGVSSECLECISAYRDLAKRMARGEKGVIEYKRKINTSGLLYCYESGVCGDKLKLRYDENRLLLTVESTGALPPEIIVEEAINTLKTRVTRVLEDLDKAVVVEKR